MASLNRKFLQSLGIEDEKIDQIIERHSEVLTEIKDERDKYKADAEKLPDVQKQLNDYKEAEKKNEKDPYKVKYEAVKEEFEDYKKQINDEKAKAKKEDAYRKLLLDAGVSEKRIEKVLKVSDVDSVEFDDDGKVKNSKELTDSIKEEWSDFITTTRQKGADVPNPPAGEKTKKTKEEIMAIKDTAERQAAMLENKELFLN